MVNRTSHAQSKEYLKLFACHLEPTRLFVILIDLNLSFFKYYRKEKNKLY